MAYYRKNVLQELVKWSPDMVMDFVSVSAADKENGSPKNGDMIALNPKDRTDMWLVAEQYAKDNYQLVGETLADCAAL